MIRQRQLLTVVLFGLGSGAAFELAARASASGLTALVAGIIAGSLLAGFLVVGLRFVEWPMEYRVTFLLTVTLISFVYWSAWLSGPVMVTSDLRITGTTGQSNLDMIRAAAIGLLFLFGPVFLALMKRNGRIPAER